MTKEASVADGKAQTSKRIKVVSTVLVLAAVMLQLWGAIASLPPFLRSVANVTAIVLAIHAVEGLISAALILRYRLRGVSGRDLALSQSSAVLAQKLPENTALAILKAGLYAFFVGTVGLVEVIDATKFTSGQALSQSSEQAPEQAPKQVPEQAERSL